MITQGTISKFAEFIEEGDHEAVERMLLTRDGSELSKTLFEMQDGGSYSAIHYCFLYIKRDDVDSYIVQKKIADLLLARNPDAQMYEDVKEFYDDIYEDYFFQPIMEYFSGLIKEGNIDKISRLLSRSDEDTKEDIAVLNIKRANGKSYPITNYCLLFIKKDDIESYVTQKEIADLLIENGALTNSPDYRGRSYDDICTKLFYRPMLEKVVGLMDRYIEKPSERSYTQFSRFVDYLNPEDRSRLAESLIATKLDPSFYGNTAQLDRILEVVANPELDDRLTLPPFPIWHDNIDDIQVDRPQTAVTNPELTRTRTSRRAADRSSRK